MNENADEYARVGRKYSTALMPDTERRAAASPVSAIYLSADARGLGADGQRLEMYEPWFELQEERRGSYAYRGTG